MLKYTLIFLFNLSLLVLTFGDYYDDEDESSTEIENVKITDVLKMIVLPPASEMNNIMGPGNNTKSHDSSKLDFILQAIEYWRKHNMEEAIEDDLVDDNNATKFTFNLRDDFFDKDGSAYSHLSKKIQSKQDSGSNSELNNSRIRSRRSKSDVFIPLPYIYVKNVYMNDKNVYKKNDRSGKVRNFINAIKKEALK